MCQLCNDNPDILLLKVDFDENRDIVKPLSIRARPAPPAAGVPGALHPATRGRSRARACEAPPLAHPGRVEAHKCAHKLRPAAASQAEACCGTTG